MNIQRDKPAPDQSTRAKSLFFYGYIVVAGAFFVFMVSFGQHNSFGVFFNPLINDFGWTRAVTSGTFSLSMALYGMLSIVMGRLNDRFGPRTIVTFCGCSLGLGYLLMSQVNAVWQLYIFFGILAGIGLSGVWVPLLSTMARWFVRRRSMMTGIVITGMGIGGLIAPPVLSRLIDAYGWRLTYVIMGGTIWLVMIVAAQLLRREPNEKGLQPYGANEEKQAGIESPAETLYFKEAIHTAQFWLFFCMHSCYGLSLFAVTVHIVPHAIDLGISAISAANILAAYGGMGIVGNLVLGSMGDRIGNRWVYIIGFILMLIALIWLMVARETWMLILFAAIFGFAQGGMAPQGSPLLARLFGLGSHGLLLGLVGLGFRVGAGIGPFMTGYIFDRTGSYQIAFLVCAAIVIAGLIFAALIRPTERLGGRV